MKFFRLLLAAAFIPITLFSQGLTISSNAVFSLGSATLSLSNDFTNDGTFNPENGTIAFTGPTGNQTYTDATNTPLNNLTVDKADGYFMLSHDITVNGDITCNSDLNLNSHTIYMGSGAYLYESAGATVMGTSGQIETTRILNAPSDLNVAGLGAMLTTTADLGSTRIVRKHNSQPTNTMGSILRYYEIEPTNNTALNATLTLAYDQDELNGLTEANLQLFRSTDGTTWLRQWGTLDMPTKKVTLSGINSFYLWTLANNEGTTLSNAGGTIGCSKGSSVEIFSSVFLTDPDDENSAGAVVQITNNYIDTEDVLSFSNKNGITGSWNNTTGKLTLSGTASKDKYVDAIRSVMYGVSSSSVTESTRTFSLTVNDGSNNSNTVYKDIKVSDSDLLPYLSVNNGTSVNEGSFIVLNDSFLRAEDPDGASASVTYNIVKEPCNGELTFNNSLLKNGSSFTFTQNDIANGKLIYTNNGSEASDDYFVFYLSDSDGSMSGNFTFNISIDGVNDPPEADSLEKILMKEDQPYMLGLSHWFNCISDPDNDDSTLTFYLTCTDNNICIKPICDTLYEITSAENYFSSDSVLVTIKDPSKDSCRVYALLIIEPVNDLPAFMGLPPSFEITQNIVTTIDINEYVNDIETPDSLLTYSFEVDADSIFINYNSENGKMNILSHGAFAGETNLTITVMDTDGGLSSISVLLTVLESVTANESSEGLPSDFILYNNYPNPFNPTTKIRYGIPLSDGHMETHVQLKIYDLLGNEIATLVDEKQNPGYFEYYWNAGSYASGIYFYQLIVSNGINKFREVKKMILMK